MQVQKRRPFSSLLLGAVSGKRTASRPPAHPRPIQADVPSAVPEDDADYHSDLDTGSQVQDRDGHGFQPEQTPAQEPILSSSAPPLLKRCRVRQSTEALPIAIEEESAAGSPSAGSKNTNLLAADYDSHQNTSQSREHSPSPVQNSCAEPRSDDDAATATGCCLLDLWAAPAPASADEPATNQASSCSLPAPKADDTVANETTALPVPEPAALLQLAPPLKLPQPQLAAPASAKRPRVSITLGSIAATAKPKQRSSCSSRPPVPPRHSPLVYRPSVSTKRIALAASRLSPSAPPTPLAPAPHHYSASQHCFTADLAWHVPKDAAEAPCPRAAPLHDAAAERVHAATPLARAGPASATAAASVLVAGPTDDLPLSVRMDREIINTMLVTRRTSSRWSEYARDGAPWTLEEEAWLMQHHQGGSTLVWLSEQLSRTRSAVKARLKRRG